jgi:hypothetical protein
MRIFKFIFTFAIACLFCLSAAIMPVQADTNPLATLISKVDIINGFPGADLRVDTTDINDPDDQPSPVAEPSTTETTAPTAKPLKTYAMSLMPESAEQRVKIEPAAKKLVVNLDSADVALRCGDGTNTYSCTAGKPLKIDAQQPITTFWAQNPSHQNTVQLRIAVYENYPAENNPEPTTDASDLEAEQGENYPELDAAANN